MYLVQELADFCIPVALRWAFRGQVHEYPIRACQTWDATQGMCSWTRHALGHQLKKMERKRGAWRGKGDNGEGRGRRGTE